MSIFKSVSWDVVADSCAAAWEHGVPQMALFYIVSQRLLSTYFPRSLYENHKHAWKLLMAGYNFLMAIYSLVTFIFLFDVVRTVPLFANVCNPSLLFQNSTFEIGTYFFYLSKYVEVCGTHSACI
jgi:hypothetical protein